MSLEVSGRIVYMRLLRGQVSDAKEAYRSSIFTNFDL